MAHSVWTKFLLRYWDAAGCNTKELRAWFHKAWQGIATASKEDDPKRRAHLKELAEQRRTAWGKAKATQARNLRMAVPTNDGRMALDDLLDLFTPPAAVGATSANARGRDEHDRHDEASSSSAVLRFNPPQEGTSGAQWFREQWGKVGS